MSKPAEQHAKRAFELMAGAFPFWAKQHTVESGRVWCSFLDDLPEDRLLAAVRSLVKSNEHPPSVAEIRATATMVRRGSCAEVVAKAKAEGADA